MRGAAGGLVAVVVALGPTQVHAVQPAKHTVDWYRTHQQDRNIVLTTCQNDHSFDDSGDCRNAQSASQGAAADSLTTMKTQDPEANPTYYGRDGSMIAITLAACAHNQAPKAWCQAATTASTNLHK